MQALVADLVEQAECKVWHIYARRNLQHLTIVYQRHVVEGDCQLRDDRSSLKIDLAVLEVVARVHRKIRPK